MDRELRTLPVAELRVEPESRKIVGYAAVFGVESRDLGGFREVVAPTAFRSAFAEGADVRSLWNHNPLYVLGRTSAGTLKLGQDERGLRFEVDPPDTQWARDLQVSIERGDVREMSFQFMKRKDQWSRRSDGSRLRTLVDVDLLEVSPVTFPAYDGTAVGVRSLDQVAAEGLAELPDDEATPEERTEQPAIDPAVLHELYRKRQALNEKAAA